MQSVPGMRTQPQWVVKGGAAPAFWLPSLCLSHWQKASTVQTGTPKPLVRGHWVTEPTALSLGLFCEMGPRTLLLQTVSTWRTRSLNCASCVTFWFLIRVSPSVSCQLSNLSGFLSIKDGYNYSNISKCVRKWLNGGYTPEHMSLMRTWLKFQSVLVTGRGGAYL